MSETSYIATEPLFVGTARAHNAGDRVPAENVERNGWQDSVVAEGSAEADQVPGLFDPSQHTVEEVVAHLADADDEESDRVLAAEREGKARVGILGDNGV